MATIGTKGCQTVRVRSGKCEQAAASLQKLGLLRAHHSSVFESVHVYNRETGGERLFQFLLPLLHLYLCVHIGCRTFAFLTSWKREKATRTWSCCVSILILTDHLSELYQPKVKFSTQTSRLAAFSSVWSKRKSKSSKIKRFQKNSAKCIGAW